MNPPSPVKPSSWHTVDHLMQTAVDEAVFPGAVLLVAHGADIQFLCAYGLANRFQRTPVSIDMCFDLASLTKPLATTAAVITLMQNGSLDLHQPLALLLPEFKDTHKADITVELLLHHRSGLPAYRPYFQRLSGADSTRRKIELNRCLLAEPLTAPIGRRTCYSDIGFMILRWIIERTTGCRLDRFVRRAVYEPLGIANLFYVDVDGLPPERPFAATETCPWRKRLLEGLVHDENAYAVGGIDGHAGLFGDIVSLHQLLSAYLAAFHAQGADSVFQPAVVRRFLQFVPGTERALGFDRPAMSGSSSGHYFTPQSVGHLGFTGTSFWMDLARSVIVVLLSNRVHFGRRNERIKGFRPVLHDAVMRQQFY